MRVERGVWTGTDKINLLRMMSGIADIPGEIRGAIDGGQLLYWGYEKAAVPVRLRDDPERLNRAAGEKVKSVCRAKPPRTFLR